MLNVAWGMPEYNTFGTGEFLRFCELIGRIRRLLSTSEAAQRKKQPDGSSTSTNVGATIRRIVLGTGE